MSFITSAANPTTAMKFYANVMDDVLAGVREAFLDEGVDEQVLQELRQMWEAKVQASKAVDPPEIVEPQPPPLQISQTIQNDVKSLHAKQTNGMSAALTQSSRAKAVSVATSATVPVNPSVPVQTSNLPNIQQSQVQPSPQVLTQPVTNNVVQEKMVPIQLTLPAPAGSQDPQSRVYNIQVPASALATDQLQRILTAQVISATMALPVNVASTLLQQHVTASLQSQTNNTQANPIGIARNHTQINGIQGLLSGENSSNRQFSHLNQVSGNIGQVDGIYDFNDEVDNIYRFKSSAFITQKKRVESLIETNGIKIILSSFVRDASGGEASTSREKMRDSKLFSQLDGVYDTSDDDEDDDDDDDLDDDDDDDDDENDDKDEEDNDEAENGVEEDPLNSGDDVSEGDNTDLFETENVVVCQYDKINRSRNKWKFYLKDGIMNLAGRDYIFQKANGDAEW